MTDLQRENEEHSRPADERLTTSQLRHIVRTARRLGLMIETGEAAFGIGMALRMDNTRAQTAESERDAALAKLAAAEERAGRLEKALLAIRGVGTESGLRTEAERFGFAFGTCQAIARAALSRDGEGESK